jgi:hypothetical protein
VWAVTSIRASRFGGLRLDCRGGAALADMGGHELAEHANTVHDCQPEHEPHEGEARDPCVCPPAPQPSGRGLSRAAEPMPDFTKRGALGVRELQASIQLGFQNAVLGRSNIHSAPAVLGPLSQ